MYFQRLQLLSIFILSAIFFTSCEREYSFENGGTPGGGGSTGSAAYTFEGGTGVCANPIIDGIYTVGVAVGATNKVTLNVNVSLAGSYTISTATTNGLIFSASGTFANTGLQTLVLQAAGIPLAAGTFSFTPGTNGCAFPIIVLPASSISTDYLRCQVDNINKTFNANLVATNQSNIITITGAEMNMPGSPNMNIALNKVSGNPVSVGIYILPSFTNLGNTCYATWSDGTPAMWAPDPLGPSNGFQVVVTEVTANRISGTFSGVLLENTGGGPGVKEMASGEFSVGF
jgi:hypothetical protein